MEIMRKPWGELPTGESVELFTLTNKRGMNATVTNYGATLVGLTAPDQNGAMTDVVLGYDTVQEYVQGRGYFGATVGRVANRLRSGFQLGNDVCEPKKNKPKFQLHGGENGFHSKLWAPEIVEDIDGPKLVLTYRSEDGEEGYPGNLEVTATFVLREAGLRIEYRATTDKTTVVSMTNHAYFNLSGSFTEDVLGHVVTLNAGQYLVTDDDQVPTGALADVSDSPLDFTRPKAIGLHIDAEDEAIAIGQGFDHYFVIDGDAHELTPAAQIFHGRTGRVLEVCTTEPGFQFYTGNHMADRTNGKLGAMYGFRGGFCVEPHGYVDAPNNPGFPSIVLEPGETYEHITEYRLSSM
ncbi:aldose epimerase family protein [Pseudodesulfovibrio sp. zrk46]|uniref:aldose epimerase family protein n=1 Tax=Pseudodesulfovibrio sp. zrk46 TaxID=2725288 RepID=UPI0014497A0D|nr:aldose epimerase family protein [Pseudodesulfovibrio sp. zrk46]QJB55349.1 galactose mutarotase [Pseudodesulfovibrio sp. zrk46]